MQDAEPLQFGRYYHIYNRGNNHENLFRVEGNFRYFLEQYAKYIHPVADTYSYCLLRNHFHLLVRIKTEEEWRQYEAKTSRVSENPRGLNVRHAPTQAFSNFFNAYAKAINKAFGRTGRLFEERFKRIEVDSDTYFTNLIFYIHFNPQKHGFVEDFREWPWSSYGAMRLSGTTKLQRDNVLNWFGGVARFEQFHQGAVDEKTIAKLITNDFD